MLEAITPNFALMKNPYNWLIVGFTLFIVISASHYLFGRKISQEYKEA